MTSHNERLRRLAELLLGPRRQWAWVLGIAALVGFAAHLYWSSWLEEAQAKEPELKETYRQRLASSRGVTELEQAQQQWTQRVTALEKHLPTRFYEDGVMSDVNAVALGRGLTLSKLERNEPISDIRPHYAVAAYSLAVTGSFADITDFLADLAGMGNIVTAQHLHWAPAAHRHLRLEATLAIYRYLSAEEIVAQRAQAAKNPAQKAGATP